MSRWELTYFNRSVANLIAEWPAGVRAHFLRTAELMTAEGPDLGLPHTRAMGDGLFEVRARGAEGIGRAFYCTVRERRIVILHAIVKKTQKTPRAALELARQRMKELHR